MGSIYKSGDGRSGPHVSYSFSYGGKQYRGSDSVARESVLSSHVAVYLDPDDPTTNGLTEYLRKSKQDHGLMIACMYAAVGLAVILAFVLVKKFS